MMLFSGDEDILVTPADTEIILGQLGGRVFYHEVIKGYGHLDFLWAPDANRRFYWRIVNELNRIHKPNV